jgi:hypothetical protein
MVNGIYVMSTAEDVEQFLNNNKSLGKREQRSQFIFTFANATRQSGTIMGVGQLAVVKPLGKTTVPEILQRSLPHRFIQFA